MTAQQETSQGPKTSYEEILGLEGEMLRMGGHNKSISRLLPPDSTGRRYLGFEKGTAFPLDHGSEISITKEGSPHHPSDFDVRYVDIGGFYFTVTPGKFVLSGINFLVNCNLGRVSGSIKVGEGIGLDMKLGLPEQKIVLDWISTSIEQRRLCQSPVNIHFFPQGQQPKS